MTDSRLSLRSRGFAALALAATSCASTGTVVGTVREAGTGRPLSGVLVHARYLGAETDDSGQFRIEFIDPGDVEVGTWRRDLVETTQRVRVRAGRESEVDLSISRAPAPCCTLAGTWSVRLVLGEPGESPAPRGTAVVGRITFSRDAPDPFPERRRRVPPDDPTVDEFGTYEIDLKPILGDRIAIVCDAITKTGRSAPEIFTEVHGFVHHRDQVEIKFIPRISDVGVGLSGTITGDEIRGTWLEHDFAPSISGTFSMRRERP